MHSSTVTKEELPTPKTKQSTGASNSCAIEMKWARCSLSKLQRSMMGQALLASAWRALASQSWRLPKLSWLMRTYLYGMDFCRRLAMVLFPDPGIPQRRSINGWKRVFCGFGMIYSNSTSSRIIRPSLMLLLAAAPIMSIVSPSEVRRHTIKSTDGACGVNFIVNKWTLTPPAPATRILIFALEWIDFSATPTFCRKSRALKLWIALSF
mmetsp:Transcript_35460/g.52907  ORF Transcript_35460/g.52907 Transcript_35460/m.52907 type:complete len:209 (-) Transcript_35460:2371-2997(-)